MDTSIHFADAEVHPVRTQSVGGVYPMRSRTKSHVNRTSVDAKISELEDAEDEDAGLRDERDFKRSQVRVYTTGAKPAY
jgi:KUP system potassium uptake protein